MLQSYAEIMHLLMNAAARQQGDKRLSFYGHVVAYDPAAHAVKVQIPSLAVDEDSPGITTGWIPLGSPLVGNGWGAQFAPEADASGIQSTIPTGTPCQIELNEMDGAATISGLRFTDKHLAPFPNMQAGEFAVKGKAGSYFYYFLDGSTKRVFQKDPNGKEISETVDKDGNLTFKLPDGTTITCTQDGYQIVGPEAGGNAGAATLQLNKDGSFNVRNNLAFVVGTASGRVAIENTFGAAEIDEDGNATLNNDKGQVTIDRTTGIMTVQCDNGINMIAAPNTIKANGNILG